MIFEKKEQCCTQLYLAQVVYQTVAQESLYLVPYMVSLNTNYRCQSNIQSCPHDASHPKAAFPLIFVCSSLTAEVDCRLEAQILLEQMEYFAMTHWPSSWGARDLQKISASLTQVSLKTFF